MTTYKDRTGRYTIDAAEPYTVKGTGKLYNIARGHFDGLADLIRWLDASPILNHQGRGIYSERHDPDAWSGTRTYAEARALVMNGWKEGRDKMEPAMAAAIAATAPMPSKAPRFDVAGEYPDVARFIAGDPMNMVRQVRASQRRRPVIKVVTSISAASNVSPQAMIYRGAAILAQVDAWEAAGWSVEIIATEVGTNTGARGIPFGFQHGAFRNDGYGMVTEITLKKAGEPMDLDALTFAMIHPAMLRRFSLGAQERIDLNLANRNSYGRPTSLELLTSTRTGRTIAQEMADEGPFVYFPPINGNMADLYSSQSRAVETVQKFASRAVFSTEENAA